MKIGIVGQGFVGSAIREGLKQYHQVQTYDINPSISMCDSLVELVDESQIIFVCLPTPMRKDGSCDTDLVRSCVHEVNACAPRFATPRPKIVVVKSTVPPGTTHDLDSECSNIDVVFSPEFLTEANSFEDFKNQAHIIVGGPRPATATVKTMFRKAFPSIPIIKTSSQHAEMVKYFINCFLATKVSFSNEVYQACTKLNIDYDKVVEYATYDRRLGTSHFSVPGPDSHFGFGGHCFPKDLNALVYLMRDLGVAPTVLSAVRDKNDEVREHRDWEEMKGRAVSGDFTKELQNEY